LRVAQRSRHVCEEFGEQQGLVLIEILSACALFASARIQVAVTSKGHLRQGAILKAFRSPGMARITGSLRQGRDPLFAIHVGLPGTSYAMN